MQCRRFFYDTLVLKPFVIMLSNIIVKKKPHNSLKNDKISWKTSDVARIVFFCSSRIHRPVYSNTKANDTNVLIADFRISYVYRTETILTRVRMDGVQSWNPVYLNHNTGLTCSNPSTGVENGRGITKRSMNLSHNDRWTFTGAQVFYFSETQFFSFRISTHPLAVAFRAIGRRRRTCRRVSSVCRIRRFVCEIFTNNQLEPHDRRWLTGGHIYLCARGARQSWSLKITCVQIVRVNYRARGKFKNMIINVKQKYVNI